HDGREHDVHEGGDELLRVVANFLKLAERLAAALILEDLEGQGERVLDPVRVELRAQPLRDHVDEVVLEVLRDPGHQSDPNSSAEKQGHADEELPVRVMVVFGRVIVDYVPENQRIQQRKNLVDRGYTQGQKDDGH